MYIMSYSEWFLLQVWLEPVPAAHITHAKFVPSVDTSSVSVLISGSPSATNLPLQVDLVIQDCSWSIQQVSSIRGWHQSHSKRLASGSLLHDRRRGTMVLAVRYRLTLAINWLFWICRSLSQKICMVQRWQAWWQGWERTLRSQSPSPSFGRQTHHTCTK